MTRLEAGKTVRRKTAATYRGRDLVVVLLPGYMEIREAGRRTSVTVDYRAAYELGWKMIARAERAAKLEAKKGKGR